MSKGKIKALFPDGVETITISKNDYDRLYGEMTLENIELKQEIERLNNIIEEIRKYVNDLYIPEFKTGKRFVETTKLLEILDKEK